MRPGRGAGFDGGRTLASRGAVVMGIGLSISRSIIERHHGRIWACAKRRGRVDLLVLDSARAGAHAGAGSDEDPVTGERSLVSVVDDDESGRESLPDLLRQFGFATRTLASAEAFLASEFVRETGCLLLDVAMPGMSGPDLQYELRRRRHESRSSSSRHTATKPCARACWRAAQSSACSSRSVTRRSSPHSTPHSD